MTLVTVKRIKPAVTRAYAHARENGFTYFCNLKFHSSVLVSFNLDSTSELEPKVSRRFVENDTLFYGKRYVVLWKTIRCFMKNKPSSVLYVEERIVFLYLLGKAMRKDNKGGVVVCKIICHHLFSAGCNTCEIKTVFHPQKGK